jgi:hypothetical protein
MAQGHFGVFAGVARIAVIVVVGPPVGEHDQQFRARVLPFELGRSVADGRAETGVVVVGDAADPCRRLQPRTRRALVRR